MKKFVLCCALLGASSAFALDAGTPDAGVASDAGTLAVTLVGIDAGALTVALVPPVSEPAAPLVLSPVGTVPVSDNDGGITYVDPFANPLGSVKEFYVAVKSGNFWWAAALLLFALVGALRIFGKKIHDLLPDTNPLDIPFTFLFDTKIGGWLMNWTTSIGLCLGASAAAGVPVDFAAWKTAIFISTTGTTLVELWKDIQEWLATRKAKAVAKAAEEAAAKLAVVANPPPTIVPDPPKP